MLAGAASRLKTVTTSVFLGALPYGGSGFKSVTMTERGPLAAIFATTRPLRSSYAAGAPMERLQNLCRKNNAGLDYGVQLRSRRAEAQPLQI